MKAAHKDVRFPPRIILIYAAAAILCIFFIHFFLRLAIVQGDSMVPTFSDGNIVAVWQWDYHPTTGDIVLTNRNNPFDVCLIKRVIAVEGQTVQIKEGVLYRDGIPLLIDLPAGEELELIVPQDYVFLIGDNYLHSNDSRRIGPIAEHDILGKIISGVYPPKRINSASLFNAACYAPATIPIISFYLEH
jgi:signal peptidase I